MCMSPSEGPAVLEVEDLRQGLTFCPASESDVVADKKLYRADLMN